MKWFNEATKEVYDYWMDDVAAKEWVDNAPKSQLAFKEFAQIYFGRYLPSGYEIHDVEWQQVVDAWENREK